MNVFYFFLILHAKEFPYLFASCLHAFYAPIQVSLMEAVKTSAFRISMAMKMHFCQYFVSFLTFYFFIAFCVLTISSQKCIG